MRDVSACNGLCTALPHGTRSLAVAVRYPRSIIDAKVRRCKRAVPLEQALASVPAGSMESLGAHGVMKTAVVRWWWVALLVLSALGCGDRPVDVGEARSQVVYGKDHRCEPDVYPAACALAAWARSSALVLDRGSIRPEGESTLVIAGTQTFAETMKAVGKPLCPEEPFQDQPDLGSWCSAFLAAPDTVVTAGHCIPVPAFCPRVAFVFGAGYDHEGRDPRRVDRDDVYYCANVVEEIMVFDGRDHAVVKLDRPVVGRAPLPLRRTGKVADDEALVLVGSPTGLPIKISAHGKVLDNTPADFFRANVDSYAGNSGSVVMGVHSGLVEGALVRGESDFVRRGDCWVSRVCPEDGAPCSGEDVSRATDFAPYVTDEAAAE